MLTWDNRPINFFTPDSPSNFLLVAQLYGKNLDILAAAPTRIANGQIQSDSPLQFVDLSEEARIWRSLPTYRVRLRSRSRKGLSMIALLLGDWISQKLVHTIT